jgi:hypothetical protein
MVSFSMKNEWNQKYSFCTTRENINNASSNDSNSAAPTGREAMYWNVNALI